MTIGDSAVRTLGLPPNSPFRSRSTIICLACLGTLLGICYMSVRAGFFTVEFASMTLLVLREIIAQVFGHQQKVDSNGNGKAP